LTAAYSSLTGIDSLIWQSIGDGDEWQNSADGKWHQGTPQTVGQFPAAALMFRRGYIKKGPPVVQEERTLADLWSRRTPLIAEDKSFDPNRDSGSSGAKNTLKSEVNPLAFLVGPVEVRYGDGPGKSTVADLKPFLNEEAKTIRSNTGEISTDYGKGLCTINTPRAQGATGFLNRFPEIKLADVTLRSVNEYATLSVVSMDGKPIRQSGKTAGTDRNNGTTDRLAGQRRHLSDDSKKTGAGQADRGCRRHPWQVTDLDATVVVTNPTLKTATVLDANGMKVRTVPTTRSGAAFTVKLPANALYVVLSEPQ
jgi:hypothetical protein